jgi:excisionase family DNA binding protein
MDATSCQVPPKKRGPRRIDGAALGVREAGGYLGFPEKKVRRLIERRLLPFRRLGGRIIFLRAELEQWLTTLEVGCTLDQARENLEARRTDQ